MRRGSWLAVLVVAAASVCVLWRGTGVAHEPAPLTDAPDGVSSRRPAEPVGPQSRRSVATEAPADAPPASVGTVRGRCVAAENGGPLAGCRVRVTTDAGSLAREVVSATDGTFTIPCEGQSRLQILASGRITRTTTISDTETWQVMDLGDVRLHRGFAVRGRVTEARGRSLPGRELKVTLPRESVQLELPLQPRGSPPSAAARSGAEGEFVLDPFVPAGAWELETEAGWLVHRPRTFWVDPDHGVEALAVVLEPAAEITGRVVDEQGQGVHGVQLTADPGATYAHTDERGSFRLVSEEAVHGEAQIRLQPWWHFERPARPTAALWGQKDLTIQVRKPQTCRFAIEVVDDLGQPVPAFRLLLMHLDDLTRVCLSYGSHKPCDRYCASPDGKEIVTDARAGRSVLRVRPVQPGLLASEPVFVDVRAGMPAPRVVLARMRPCPVEVTGAGGAPADVDLVAIGASLEDAKQSPKESHDCAHPAGFPAVREAEILARTRTRSDGSAELFAPTAGGRGLLLRVRAEGLAPVFVQDPPLDPGRTLRIAVTRSGTVAGEVALRGSTHWSLRVALRRSTGETGPEDSAVIERDGTFALPGVAAGAYEIGLERWTQDPRWSGGWCALPASFQTVRVEEGATARVVLSVPAVAPAAVLGRVHVAGADPSAFAARLVHLAARDALSRPFPLADDGRFAATDLPPGRYRLALERADHRDRQSPGYFGDLIPIWGRPPAQLAEEFEVGPGQTLQREFSFTPRRLVLHPRTADGAPVPVCELRIGTWQLAQMACDPLILDPAPEIAVQVRLPHALAPWSEPVVMPQDRREHTAVVVVPALVR